MKRVLFSCTLLLCLVSSRADAVERLCDPAFEDCRAQLLTLIDSESSGIDVAFWFMEDARISNAIIQRFQAGVPVRVLFDSDAVPPSGTRRTILNELAAAGVPLRHKTSSGIVHWKMMLFAGQHTVEFSGANYSPTAFVPQTAYADYVDELIYFTDQPSLVNSFMSRYDDVWTASSGYSNYANIQTLSRRYPTYSIDPELNFVPWENFATRSVARYYAETQQIDALMYRITDRRHTDALIAARARGVGVRLITEQDQYRDPSRLWDAWNVDRLYMAGVQVRIRAHAGLMHEKLALLHGQHLAVFGSSNWTGPSAESQLEHNLFTTDSTFYATALGHFERKWNNSGPSPETQPFEPLPPDTPDLKAPANGATGQSQSVALRWYAGPWAHRYDVYIGTSPDAMQKVLDAAELGPSETSTDYISFTMTGLATQTTYFWQVVSRTMADRTRASAVWSFTTGSSTPSPTPPPPTSGASYRLFWQHDSTGQLSVWNMAGSGLGSGPAVSPSSVSDPNWRLVGSGDFNGDGQRDLLWFHRTLGVVSVWLMNGNSFKASGVMTPHTVSDTDWEVRAVADLNGDGHPDIIWQHRRAGWLVVWLMNGLQLIEARYLTPNRVTNTDWLIVGAADFDGDGNADLLWQNVRTGLITAWLMNGTSYVSSGVLSLNQVSDTDWRIRGVVDVDGNGSADLIWQDRSSGWLAVWFMSRLSYVSSRLLTPDRVADTNWRIAAIGK